MKTVITRSVLAAGLLATALVMPARAQQTPAPAPAKLMTFKVDVTLTRLAGNTALGASPFSLLVNTGGGTTANSNTGRASLRVGVEVPTGTATRATNSNATSTQTETVFKTVGTQIDASVAAFDESRYAVDVSINDTAVFSDGDDAGRVNDARRNLELAQKTLERQTELFRKNLTTNATLNRAEAAVRQAETNLDIAQRGPKALGRADQMAFRSFTSSNRVYLRDGETQEMTVATDRTSGETIRASVKLTVVK